MICFFNTGTVVRAGVIGTFLICMIAATQLVAYAQDSRTRTTATKIVKAASSASSTSYSYFPTASTTDGRMVSIVGAGLQSMAGSSVEFGIGMPGSSDTLRMGIFDGETGGTWDLGTSPLTYTLYADSTADGSGSVQIASWSGSSMTDNAWYEMSVPVSAAAMSSDSVYFYRLVVSLSDASQKTWSNFKLRTNGTAMLLPRSFQFAVPLFSEAEAQILYPNYPSTATTTYDGTWSFKMAVSEAVENLEIWDGDMDFGSSDGVNVDTDDADTPSGLPTWADNTAAVAEGVATSNEFITVNGVKSTTTRSTGAPSDDNSNALYRRSPAVEYTVVDPNGTSYRNANPSGNLEWERFGISTVATSASDYDYLATLLPAGIYTINVSGMDLGNLNAWRVWYGLLGTSDSTGGSDAQSTDAPSTSNFRSYPVIAAVDAAGDPVDVVIPLVNIINGVGTPKWWRTHPENWPVEVITVGGISYTKSDAISEVLEGNSADPSKNMARELIAAKLNAMMNNASSCIVDDMADAEEYLAEYPIGCGRAAFRRIAIALRLYTYNRGTMSCTSGGLKLD